MRICDKCGTQQSDNCVFCMDCGNRLNKNITGLENAKIKEQTERNFNKSDDKKDGLYVRVIDKIIGILSFIGVIIDFIFINFYMDNTYCFLLLYFSIMSFVFCFIYVLFPKFLWNIKISKLRSIIKELDDATPTEYYLHIRKITVYMIFASSVIISCLCIIILLKDMCN